MPIGANYLRCKNLNARDINSSILNVYQIGPFTNENKMLLSLLKMVAAEPLYSTLRTVEQLAYSVSFDIYRTLNILHYKIGVESQETKFTAAYVDERIEHFRQNLLRTIEHMSQDDFDTIKATIVRNKLSDFNGVNEEAQHNWIEIDTNRYEFNRRYKEVECLTMITKDQLFEFYRAHCGPNERKLSIQIIGNAHGNEATNVNAAPLVETQRNNHSDGLTYIGFGGESKGNLIDDFMAFKNSLDIYPAERTS